ncbi:hypothetical protein [Rhizobium sp. LEGMi135b]
MELNRGLESAVFLTQVIFHHRKMTRDDESDHEPMKPFLFDQPLLPSGFHFPASYLALVTPQTLPDIQPWEFLAGNMAASLSYYGFALERFAEAALIPFAMIRDKTGLDNDGYVTLAFFYGSSLADQPRVHIYDFARPKLSPWDNLSYESFDAWLEAAKEESAEYKAMRAEADGP